MSEERNPRRRLSIYRRSSKAELISVGTLRKGESSLLASVRYSVANEYVICSIILNKHSDGEWYDFLGRKINGVDELVLGPGA